MFDGGKGPRVNVDAAQLFVPTIPAQHSTDIRVHTYFNVAIGLRFRADFVADEACLRGSPLIGRPCQRLGDRHDPVSFCLGALSETWLYGS